MKILAVQNRMGIGDTVIFLPFIKALSKKFNSPISILVKENSKADQFLYQTNYIDKILFLERDTKTNKRHGGFLGSLNLIKDIKKHKFDKIVFPWLSKSLYPDKVPKKKGSEKFSLGFVLMLPFICH